MQLNIANPLTGCQIKLDIVDEHKLRMIYNKSLSTEIDGQILGTEMRGYLFKISGGNDKQGFGMKQGVLTHSRVRLLMSPGDSCFSGRGRQGKRQRKSVRGCIVSPDIASLNLTMIKQGEKPILGLTDREIPLSRGPRRSSKVCKLFHLMNAKDDIISYSKTFGLRIPDNSRSDKRKKTFRRKISRLLTPLKLQRNNVYIARKVTRMERSHTKAVRYHESIVSRLNHFRRFSQTLAKRRLTT